jgi:hypothetical protein
LSSNTERRLELKELTSSEIIADEMVAKKLTGVQLTETLAEMLVSGSLYKNLVYDGTDVNYTAFSFSRTLWEVALIAAASSAARLGF